MLAAATSLDMVGREPELQVLKDALEKALTAAPQGVLVLGEPGIGKTRLVDELIAALPPDVVVARGLCLARGSAAPPLRPVREVLRGILSRVGNETVIRCAGPTAGVLGALLPELGVARDTRVSPDQAYDAVTRLLEAVSAEVPLLVVVEDVHWADGPTLDMLRAFLHLLSRGRVCVVATCRTGEVDLDEPHRAFLTDAARSRAVAHVELSRLDPEQVARQVRLIGGESLRPSEMEELVRRSDGVPFLVEELVALRDAGPGALPRSLRELLLARYTQLSTDARAVVRLLAAGGTRVEHRLVAQVHDGPDDVLDAAVREAVEAHVLTTEGDTYTFRHALTQEAVYGELVPGERRRLHARYADALEAGPPRLGRSAEIAHHRLAADQLPEAFTALVTASREASAGGTPLGAGRLGRAALDPWDDVPEAWDRAGCTCAELFREVISAFDLSVHEEALDLLDTALARIGPDDPAGRALLLHEAMVVRYHFSRSEGAELCRQALDLVAELPGEQAQFVRARVRCGLGIVLSFLLDPSGPVLLEEATGEIRTLLQQTTDPRLREHARLELVRAVTNLATARADRREVGATLAALAEARDLAGDDPAGLLRVDERVLEVLLGAGRYAEARDGAMAAWELARDNGMQRGWGAGMLLMQAVAQLGLGDLDACGTTLADVRALMPVGAELAILEATSMELHLSRGDVESAHAVYARSVDQLEDLRRGDPGDGVIVARACSWLHLARGEAAAAWGELETAWSHPIPPSVSSGALLALGAVVLATLRRAGQAPPGLTTQEAEKRLRRTFATVASSEQEGDWGPVLHAELAGPGGTGTDVAAWEAAVEVSGRGRVPRYQYAYCLYRLAQARLSVGDRPAAAQAVTAAHTVADGAGMLGLVRQVDDLARRGRLRRPAHRPVRGAPTHVSGAQDLDGVRRGEAPLTKREREVLALVAEGLTNRQIGQRLFMSDRTASVHVSAILRKLGALSRAEAAARAAEVLDPSPG